MAMQHVLLHAGHVLMCHASGAELCGDHCMWCCCGMAGLQQAGSWTVEGRRSAAGPWADCALPAALALPL
jgi:hypothetical protein